MRPVKVSQTMTRNYGMYTMSFGAETTIEASTRADFIREQAALTETLKAAILDFEMNQLRSLPGFKGKPASYPPINQDQKGAPAAKGVWVRALGMIKETKKGKDYFYIKTAEGTKWSKFGVSLYFDNFEGMTRLEYDKRCDAAGELLFPEDMYVAVISQEGKPDRAMALQHKDTIDLEG